MQHAYLVHLVVVVLVYDASFVASFDSRIRTPAGHCRCVVLTITMMYAMWHVGIKKISVTIVTQIGMLYWYAPKYNFFYHKYLQYVYKRQHVSGMCVMCLKYHFSTLLFFVKQMPCRYTMLTTIIFSLRYHCQWEFVQMQLIMMASIHV